MITKETLKSYRMLKLELEDTKQKINSRKLQDNVQGSMKNYPYILQTKRIEGLPKADEELLKKKTDIEKKLLEIENFVKKIPNYKIRKAVQIYYMADLEDCEKPTWEYVADKFNDGSTSASIKMSVKRYLENF